MEFAIALWIFLGLSVLAALFGEETPTSQQASGNEGIVAKQPEIKTYAIGDEVVAGDFTWKITKVSTATEIGEYALGNFMGEKADGVFVILDVEVENTGKSAQYLTDSFIKLVDDQNREFSPNTVAAIYLKPQGSALVFEQINPGITKKGKIVRGQIRTGHLKVKWNSRIKLWW